MSRTRELLVRTGVVKIFIQIPGIDSVEIYVGKKPLTNSKGEEVGAMNVMFKIGGKIITPALTGSVLPGITRKSCIELL